MSAAGPISAFRLFDDGGDDAGADRAPAFADRESAASRPSRSAQSGSHPSRCCRPASPSPSLPADPPSRHVRRAEVKLRTIVREERRVTAPFFLRQHVALALELRVRRDRARLRQNLAALNIFTADPTQQQPTLSPASPWSSSLRNISTPVHRRLRRVADADNLDFLATFTMPAQYGPSQPCHGPRSRTRPRSASGTAVNRAVRLRNVLVNRCHQLQDRVLADLRVLSFQRRQRRALDDRNIVARESHRTTAAREPQAQPAPAAPDRRPGQPCSGTRQSPERQPDAPAEMCSRVCGIGPSAAETTRIAPSICAAPVIMFFT